MPENYTYRIEPTGGQESVESVEDVPIIDIVRHGPTEYKELGETPFEFNPGAKDFALDDTHLDLTKEGIELVRETGKQLAGRIDRTKEIVLIMSSPNFRAQSTALLIDDELRKAGVPMLLSDAERLHMTKNLRQISFRDADAPPTWIAADKAFRAEDERNRRLPPGQVYKVIAARLGKDFSQIFTEDMQSVRQRFFRFVRHASNMHRYFGADTKELLKGKKLRIIAVTHEEVPALLMEEGLPVKEGLKRGQILELRPQDKLAEGEANRLAVELLPQGSDSESHAGTITVDISKERE